MRIKIDTASTVTALIAVAGAILWLSVMFADLSHATSKINKLESYQKDIGSRLSRIEGKIDVLLERKTGR